MQRAEKDGDIIKYFLDTAVLRDYLTSLRKDNYTYKTVLNRLFALERFCSFIEEKLAVLVNQQFTSLLNNKRTKEKIRSIFEWIGAEIKEIGPIATEETRVRNSKEALIKENKWVDAVTVFNKEIELKPTIDALFEEISAATSRPSQTNLEAVQDYIMFLLVTQRPTMRTQNLKLKILADIQSPKEAKKNCIVFTEQHVVLQYAKYKTKK